MTVAELIETLQGFEGNLEVRIANQPSYPFEHRISQVWQDEEDSEYKAVYLVDGGQIGYFTKRAWE